MKTARLPGLPLTRVVLACAAGLAAAGAFAAQDRAEELSRRLSWIQSPYHRFGPPQTLVPGRAVLRDETDDPALASLLSAELRRLFAELYGREGWRVPFADGQPIGIYLARREAEGVRQIAARSVEEGRLVSPALLLDGTGLTTGEIVREVSRQIALATLEGYGAREDTFLLPAVASFLAGAGSDSGGEDLAILTAASALDLRRYPTALGPLWVAEMARAAGGVGFLRLVWERAGDTGEAPMPLLLRMFAEASGESGQAALLRCAARLYVSLEPEAAPSRLRLLDLESGALDAAPPEAMSLRHRSFLPEGLEESLRVAWPEDGGEGAAIIRYRDADLPPDVVFFRAGDLRTIPLAGVARVDWLVAGRVEGAADGVRAPVYCERSTTLPFSGLEPHASAGSDGPRLWWRTATHDGLWGWAVFREEVLADGRIARSGPEVVPSSERAEEPFGYVFVDKEAKAGTFYRYTVWAVTDAGTLGRAFAATLKTPD
ncbi:MAG TPA: hypothetical protein VGL03_01830 [Thermoanaerobaculia bacterium]|jgi:hypothetical protein